MTEENNNTTAVAIPCPQVIIPTADDLEEIILSLIHI